MPHLTTVGSSGGEASSSNSSPFSHGSGRKTSANSLDAVIGRLSTPQQAGLEEPQPQQPQQQPAHRQPSAGNSLGDIFDTQGAVSLAQND